MSRAHSLLRSSSAIPRMFPRARPSLQCVSTLKNRPGNYVTEEGGPVKVTIGPDGTTCEVITPGFNYNDLDRKGLTFVQKSAALTTKCRHAAWNAGFLRMKELRKKSMTFIIGMEFHFTPAFYEIASRCQHLQGKIQCTLLLEDIGRSSFVTCSRLYDVTSQCILYSGKQFWVHVDKQTRKPKEIPEWFVTSFQPKESPALKRNKTAISTGFEAACESIIQVEAKDIDHFGHTNHESYLRFCAECISNAVEKGKVLKSLRDQPLLKIRDLYITFYGESGLHDELSVFVFTDASSPNDVISQVYKLGKPIVECRAGVYPVELSSL